VDWKVPLGMTNLLTLPISIPYLMLRSIGRLQTKVAEMKASNSQRLVQEYQALVAGLTDQGILQSGGADTVLASPVLPDDIMQVIDTTHLFSSSTSHSH
jgi:hypothetical protein